jgi:hypothetical protein
MRSKKRCHFDEGCLTRPRDVFASAIQSLQQPLSAGEKEIPLLYLSPSFGILRNLEGTR